MRIQKTYSLDAKTVIRFEKKSKKEKIEFSYKVEELMKKWLEEDYKNV